MQRLIIDIESPEKAKELQSMLSDLNSVSSVIMISDLPDFPQERFESEDEFYAEMDRRVQALESGEDKGLSIEELVEETRKMHRKRA